MSFEVHSKTLTGMWKKANNTLWNMKDDEFDFVRQGVTVHSFHNQLHSKTAEIDLTISDFGYTKTKWSMLLKLYFDPLSYALALERIKRYRAEPRGKRYVVDIPISFKQRLNASGECLLGMTVRFSEKRGWEAEVMTRASESISRWGVDLVFVHVLLREMGKELGFTPKDIAVHWNSASMFQSILTAPLFVCTQMKNGEKMLLNTKKPMATRWQEEVRTRFHRSFLPGERRYSTFRSQQRVVKAYDVLCGRETARHILHADDLNIPSVQGIELPERFLVKGGFK